jgi:hypothetical protein
MEPLVLTARGYLLEATDPNPRFTFGMFKLGIAFRHFLGTRACRGSRLDDGPMPGGFGCVRSMRASLGCRLRRVHSCAGRA